MSIKIKQKTDGTFSIKGLTRQQMQVLYNVIGDSSCLVAAREYQINITEKDADAIFQVFYDARDMIGVTEMGVPKS